MIKSGERSNGEVSAVDAISDSKSSASVNEILRSKQRKPDALVETR